MQSTCSTSRLHGRRRIRTPSRRTIRFQTDARSLSGFTFQMDRPGVAPGAFWLPARRSPVRAIDPDRAGGNRTRGLVVLARTKRLSSLGLSRAAAQTASRTQPQRSRLLRPSCLARTRAQLPDREAERRRSRDLQSPVQSYRGTRSCTEVTPSRTAHVTVTPFPEDGARGTCTPSNSYERTFRFRNEAELLTRFLLLGLF